MMFPAASNFHCIANSPSLGVLTIPSVAEGKAGEKRARSTLASRPASPPPSELRQAS